MVVQCVGWLIEKTHIIHLFFIMERRARAQQWPSRRLSLVGFLPFLEYICWYTLNTEPSAFFVDVPLTRMAHCVCSDDCKKNASLFISRMCIILSIWSTSTVFIKLALGAFQCSLMQAQIDWFLKERDTIMAVLFSILWCSSWLSSQKIDAWVSHGSVRAHIFAAFYDKCCIISLMSSRIVSGSWESI